MSDNQFSQNEAPSFKERISLFMDENPKVSLGLKVLLGLFILGIVSTIIFVMMIRFGTFGNIPSEADIKNIKHNTASEVYSEDGVLLGKYFIQNRTTVNYDDISENLINALVATEDARFFEHKGVDFRSAMRVLFKTVLMGDDSSGGGSTLSQQLAKNLYPRKRHRFLSIPINKIREMFTARRLEKAYSKEELLNLYLNTVPFSGNIYGVQVASKQFFNTTPKDIKIEEAAVLVGMLKATTSYNPVNNPERALKRRNVILNQMQKYGYITSAACEVLKKKPLGVSYNRESNTAGIGTYFREHLRLELKETIKNYKKPDGSEYNIYTDGLKIYTTVDSRMQEYAEKAVKEHLAKLQKDFDEHWQNDKPWRDDNVLTPLIKKSSRYKKLKAAGKSEAAIRKNFAIPVSMTIYGSNGDEVKTMSPLDSIKYYYSLLSAGFLVMEPNTGHIKAWVGGTDQKYFQYDHVKSRRQVGSTFKPIVYATALKNGVPPCEYIDNRLVTYTEYDDWQPQNSDGHYGGVYSMAGAMTGSVNSVAVNLIMRTGVDSVKMMAEYMGISSNIPEVPAIALGAVDISLYDMVQVYGTFANRGIHPTPYYISRIETARGEIIADFDMEESGEEERVFTEDETDMIIHMMKSVVDNGTGRRLRFRYNFENQIAGKTGTTQSHADGWFIGYTPNLVAGAWVGGQTPDVRFRTISLGQGANTALPIWAEFMKQVYADPAFEKMQYDTFPGPSPEIAEALNCANYLEERPPIVEATELDPEINPDLGDFIEAAKTKRQQEMEERMKKNKNKRNDRAPRTKSSSKSEEIKKKNEKTKKKRERKKKRKKFFDRIFKGGG